MTAIEFARYTSLYENSLPKEIKKANGIFYTGLSLAENIISELRIPDESYVIDPCCGTGSFCYAALRKGIKFVFGADIDKSAIRFCTDSFPECRFIKADTICPTAGYTLTRMGLDAKADYVIGNPPYAKWVPSRHTSLTFNEKVVHSGNNLFVAALIRAMQMVKENGIISYIIPKNFLHVATYSSLRKEILQSMTIVSIIDIGAYFKDVRGEQIVLTIRNTVPETHSCFSVKKLVNDRFIALTELSQAIFTDEIMLFSAETDIRIFNKLNNYIKLDSICTGYIGRGRSKSESAISGKQIRKFGLKDRHTPHNGNQIFIQNIYSTESGIIATFGGNLDAGETVTVLTDGDERTCRLILGLLHSKVCNFFLYQYCFNSSRLTMHTDAKYLQKLPMPQISPQLSDCILSFVQQLENETYLSNGWFSLLKQLDNVVYKAYKLNTGEIEFIENKMKTIQSKKWNNEP